MGEHLRIFHENFWKHFDKILLASLFLLTLGASVWMTLRATMDEGSLDWTRSTANLILGGLLGLITGRLLEKYKPEDKP